MVFFDQSTPERRKRAKIKPVLERLAIPAKIETEYLTIEELCYGKSLELVFDVECYINYFLCGFKCVTSGKTYTFEANNYGLLLDTSLLGFVLFRHKIIGFNSKSYDLPMLGQALDGVECWKLKEFSDRLIFGAERPPFELRLAKCNHIDLIEVAPLTASLKMYGARLHCKRLQELPYDHNKELTYEEAMNVKDYNLNDLDVTIALYNELKPSIELREAFGRQYGIDLRSKSDAQMTEALMRQEVRSHGITVRPPEIAPGTVFRFVRPEGLSFRSEALRGVLERVLATEFVIGLNGAPSCPTEMPKINVGNVSYQMGIGGLHSCEKSLTVFSDENYQLIDRDVKSYYPFILLNQELHPTHIPKEVFLDIFRGWVYRRLDAKAAGNKTEADGLKIGVNGLAGKLSEQFSIVYCPHVNTQMCVSGQLFLLMLIERIEDAGISVVSANTDGVVIFCHNSRRNDLDEIVKVWERDTGFETEEVEYKSIHCRDVNNYIAIKHDNSCKTKGVYSELGSALNSVLSKNPESLIISDAVQAFLSKGVEVEQTIRNCRDIRRFVNVRNVKGGGYYGSTYLGKTVRWYYVRGSVGCISYVLSNNTVPKSEGCRPIMELPDEIPEDLNYDYYINEAYETLFDIGYNNRIETGVLF